MSQNGLSSKNTAEDPTETGGPCPSEAAGEGFWVQFKDDWFYLLPESKLTAISAGRILPPGNNYFQSCFFNWRTRDSHLWGFSYLLEEAKWQVERALMVQNISGEFFYPDVVSICKFHLRGGAWQLGKAGELFSGEDFS